MSALLGALLLLGADLIGRLVLSPVILPAGSYYRIYGNADFLFPPVWRQAAMKISLSDLCFGYADRLVLKEFNCIFASGAITAVLGVNGSGKNNPPEDDEPVAQTPPWLHFP
ncbi:hypothetical protein [uncultured Desulfuromusa sp.]|uniref:hypothetical protein n=1 Tax=uncultured Desulfuromusa sp. TaxID=219183 RepID=UPI002AA69AA2|nr:hypothetical protein [uncultured Desulfuromusa sp.]